MSFKSCIVIRDRFGGVDRPKGGVTKIKVTHFSAPKAPKNLKSDPLLDKKRPIFGIFATPKAPQENFSSKTP